MLQVKEGYPEENELVIVTITKVQPHSVFANLDEYNKSGMIHISEVSPGRIRNIRDYVKEGKVVICKVLKVNKERGYIDLSLRRVTEGQKKAKANELKHQQMAETIIEFAAKQLKKDTKKFYTEIEEIILKKYDSLYEGFEAVTNEKKPLVLEKIGIEKNAAKELTELIKQRIKPPECIVGGKLKLITHANDGVSVIKKAIETALKVDKRISIKYGGAGVYNVEIKCSTYKEAEDILKKTIDKATNSIEKADGEASFERVEKK